jgi:hypothetical protein
MISNTSHTYVKEECDVSKNAQYSTPFDGQSSHDADIAFFYACDASPTVQLKRCQMQLVPESNNAKTEI